MFFWGFGVSAIFGPAGAALSLLPPPLLPICVAITATMPATSTTAASTSSQRLKRREDKAVWTTFTAILSVDEEIAVRLDGQKPGVSAHVPQTLRSPSHISPIVTYAFAASTSGGIRLSRSRPAACFSRATA